MDKARLTSSQARLFYKNLFYGTFFKFESKTIRLFLSCFSFNLQGYFKTILKEIKGEFLMFYSKKSKNKVSVDLKVIGIIIVKNIRDPSISFFTFNLSSSFFRTASSMVLLTITLPAGLRVGLVANATGPELQIGCKGGVVRQHSRLQPPFHGVASAEPYQYYEKVKL